MKFIMTAMAATLLLSAAPANAQTALDHKVQRAWDDVFNPPPPGDPRTNWERRHDAYNARRRQAYEQRREAYRAGYDRRRAEHEQWCRYHPGAQGCYYR